MRFSTLLLCVSFCISLYNSAFSQCTTCSPDILCFEPNKVILCPSSSSNLFVNQASLVNFSLSIPPIISLDGESYSVIQFYLDSFSSECPGIGVFPPSTGFPVHKSAPEVVCFSLCGTPIYPGKFYFQIPVMLTVSNGIITKSFEQNVFFTINILPKPQTNSIFSSIIQSSCDSFIVHASANEISDTIYPETIVWDWKADGVIEDTSPDFTAKTLTPGVHYLQARLLKFKYRVSNVRVNDLAEATWYWHEFCGDGTGFTLFGTPVYTHINDADLTMSISDGFSTYLGPQIDNDDSPEWNFNMPFYPLSSSVRISFQESDAAICGSGQSGGSATVSVWREGVYNFTTSGGDGPVSGSFTIQKYLDSTIDLTDTFYFFPNRINPTLFADKDTFCMKDSFQLVCLLSPEYQPLQTTWFQNDLPWMIDSSKTQMASQPGSYSVQILDSLGCVFASNEVKTYEAKRDARYLHIINIAANQLALTQTLYVGFGIKWYRDGVLIADTNSSILSSGFSGAYYCEVYNKQFPECTSGSDTLNFIPNGVFSAPETNLWVYPNPCSDEFFINLTSLNTFSDRLYLVNALGEVVKTWNIDEDNRTQKFELSNVPSGIYHLKTKDFQELTYKLTILK